MQDFLSFADVAQRMQSSDSSIQRAPYWNRRGTEGSSICFFHLCEWFEVNVHDAAALSPEEALKLLQASPDTLLDNSDTDKYDAVRWYGGARVGQHHVRVWYNPQAL